MYQMPPPYTLHMKTASFQYPAFAYLVTSCSAIAKQRMLITDPGGGGGRVPVFQKMCFNLDSPNLDYKPFPPLEPNLWHLDGNTTDNAIPKAPYKTAEQTTMICSTKINQPT